MTSPAPTSSPVDTEKLTNIEMKVGSSGTFVIQGEKITNITVDFPVDEAANIAVNRLIDRRILASAFTDSSVAARIITDAYEKKKYAWMKLLFEESYLLTEANEQIESLDICLTAERAVREKLMEVCKSLIAARKAHNIDIAVEDATNSAIDAIAEAEKLEKPNGKEFVLSDCGHAGCDAKAIPGTSRCFIHAPGYPNV